MYRQWFCLLICLFLVPAPPPHGTAIVPSLREVNPILQTVADDGSPLPDDTAMQRLAQQHPVAFLENCLRRCGREVVGFEALLFKHERIGGQLQQPELLRASFREHPHGVLLKWVRGERQASAVLFVTGENSDKILVRPAGLFRNLLVVQRDPYGADARQNGRYALPEFGIKFAMQRTLASWTAAQRRGRLQVSYLGIRQIPELNNRVCHILHRTGFDPPEDDGVADVLFYFDQENWLQTGSVLRDSQNELIAEYYFRDLTINPTFPDNRFTRQGLF